MGLINLSPIGRFHRTAGYVTSRLTNQRVIKNEKQPFCLHLQLSQDFVQDWDFKVYVLWIG